LYNSGILAHSAGISCKEFNREQPAAMSVIFTRFVIFCHMLSSVKSSSPGSVELSSPGGRRSVELSSPGGRPFVKLVSPGGSPFVKLVSPDGRPFVELSTPGLAGGSGG